MIQVDVIFRIAIGIMSVLLASIRLNFGWQAVRSGQKVILKQAGKIRTRLLWLLGGVAALESVVYVVSPRWLRWASVSLPASLRYGGIGLGMATVLLFYSVHKSLGKNWEMPGVIKDRQTLVTSGLYRWVRHPMYSTLYVWAVAYFLLSANWLVGAAWLGLAVISTTMAAEEEAALIKEFGESYRSYMQRTGRFLPPFKR